LSLAVGALALAVTAPMAVAGVAGCPTGSVPTASYATANLGSTASKCGTVTAGANSVTAAIPSGYPGDQVEIWLGVLLSLPDGFQGQSASVLRFDNFQAVLGSTIDFNWDSSFDPLTEGYVFALLDGQKSVLTEVTSSASATVLNSQHTQLTINSSGAHSLALGVVEGCSAANCIVGNITGNLDPSATFSAVTLADPLGAAAPEPATISMLMFGLAAIGLGMFRRKRS